MTLLRQIQDQAASGDTRVADLLRKCKILAARLKSAEFGAWVERELNGYSDPDSLPDYRINTNAIIKGSFTGPLGSSMNRYPIPSGLFPEDIEEDVKTIRLMQGVAAMEDLLSHKEAGEFQVPLPSDVTSFMARRIVEHYYCHSLWQSLSRGVVVNVLDSVKTKVLGFALDIEKENPEAGEAELNSESGPVPPAAVQQAFHQNFYGTVGNVATGSHGFKQEATLNQQSLTVDLPQLARELPVLRQALLVEASEPEHYAAIGAVREAEIEAEKKDTPKLLQSLSKAGTWAFDVATKIGTSVAAEAIKHSLGGVGWK